MDEGNDPRPVVASNRLNRRALLAGGVGAGAALGAVAAVGLTLTAGASQEATPDASPQVPGHDPAGTAGHDHMASPTAAPAQTPISDPVAYGFVQGADLVQPEERVSKDGLLEVTLTASMGPTVVAGMPVTALNFDGLMPGPTLRFNAGDTLKVTFDNQLDEKTNLHTHGLHVSPGGNSDNIFVTIDPGTSFDYEYDLPTNHPPGTYWYHPHHHGLSNRQIALGLAGVMLQDGIVDLVPGLESYPTKLLAIQAMQFDVDGVVLPTSQQTDPMHLVNGQWQPVIRIAPGEIQRWQIANITAGNVYQIALENHVLLQIASDANPFDSPQPESEFLLGPGERADVLVQGSATPGTYQLRHLMWGAGFQFTPDKLLATVIVEGDPVTADPIPEFLVPFEDLRLIEPDRQREIVFQIVEGAESPYQIDGRPFDEHRVDQRVPLNAMEEWVIYNTSEEWHPFHIHVNDFQVVAINNEPYTAHSYEDTYLIPAHGSFTMRSRFLDFTGKYVYHCHILFHEDHSMMGIVEVVAE
jgi:FtsP/CotA-like multicopper oxidase with cupredoxin domain